MKRFFIMFAACVFIAACSSTPIVDTDILGVYSGSISSPKEDIILILTEDGSAELNISGSKGSVRKTGSWRLDGKRVILVLLRSNDRSINEKITFSVDGNELWANGELRHGKFRAFGDGGMTLTLKSRPDAPDQATSESESEGVSIIVTKQVAPAPADASLEHALKLESELPRYLHSLVDLDGDGVDDALVFMGPCPEDGCQLLAFRKTPDSFKLLGSTSGVHGPVIVSEKTTNGIRDIVFSQTKDEEIVNKILRYRAGKYPATSGDADLVTQTIKGETHLGTAVGSDWGSPVSR